MEKNVEISIMLDFYGSLLTDTQNVAIREHYDEDQSFAEIGERLGKSRQAVHDAVSHGVGALYEFEEKLGIMKRYLAFDKMTAELYNIADTVDDSNKERLTALIFRMQKLWEDSDGL